MRDAVFEALQSGATLLTASHRLARQLLRAYGQQMQQQGRIAWVQPSVLAWTDWLAQQREWLMLGTETAQPLLLTPFQELSLWEAIIAESAGRGDPLLQTHATARTAREAWRLVCEWRLPPPRVEDAPNEDVAAFARWSQVFRARCAKERWLDSARLPDVIGGVFRSGDLAAPDTLVLAGFDVLTPQQQQLLAVLEEKGTKLTLLEPGVDDARATRVGLADARAEILAAAHWARRCLEADDNARIAIVIRDLEAQRARVQRALDDAFVPAALLIGKADQVRPYNITLGRALADYPAIAAALAVLEAGAGPLPIHAAGRLLRSPFLGAGTGEAARRAQLDVVMRRSGELNVSMAAILRRASASADDGQPLPSSAPQLAHFLRQWQEVLHALPGRQLPSAWAESFARLLAAIGWPGERTLDSNEYQTVIAWRDLLSAFSAQDLVTPRLGYREALSLLRRLAQEKVFQPMTPEVPVQVMGLLEAAGQEFDALWVMGLHDDVWPASARPNPFLPLGLQRAHAIPHASAGRELAYARAVTERLSRSAREVIFSYPQAEGDKELRPSPLLAGFPEDGRFPPPRDAALGYAAALFAARDVEPLDDAQAPVLPAGTAVGGGTNVFRLQAACPFRAFAEIRLAAVAMEEPEIGLDRPSRGRLLHSALEYLWRELGSHARLCALGEAQQAEVVARVVEQALTEFASKRPSVFTAHFMQLEQARLVRLLREWLVLEHAREPFSVLPPEQETTLSFGGIAVQARIDRTDRLDDDTRVVIDYKSGKTDPHGWLGERPDEPQLPLYAVASPEPVSAVLFAQVQLGDMAFKGVAQRQGVAPGVVELARSKLVAETESWEELFSQWRAALDTLGEQFRLGDARVDPKDYPHTCKYCPLVSLCRVQEHTTTAMDADSDE